MEENKYLKFMGSDNDLCTPIMEGEKINYISILPMHYCGLTDPQKFPKTMLDLEQIQVLDYTKIPNNTLEQITYIERILRKSPFAPEDLAFLALKSLYSYSWDQLETQEDAILALKVEGCLNSILKDVSMEIAGNLIYQDSLLPYWVRLSFLRVMSKIPEDVIEVSNLKSVTCFPIKKKSFNAFSAMLDESSIIGFNYALEPILKILNRFFIHFYTTQHLAGPSRISRAWGEVLPIVRYFSGKAGAMDLMSGCLTMSMDDASNIHGMVADQVDFIMMHELGHIYYSHPKLLSEIIGCDDEITKRHKLEVQADEFSHKIFKSWFYESHDEKEELNKKLNEYSVFLESVELSFIYIGFINTAKSIINKKLGQESNSKDSHPSFDERLLVLRSAAGIEINSDMVKFAEEFFSELINHISSLDKENIESGLALRDPLIISPKHNHV